MQEIDIVSFSVSVSTGFCAVKFVNYLFFLGLPSESIHFALITAWAFIYLSQLMRLWLISHRGTGKAQASLCIHTVSPEPSLFAHMKYGSRRRVRPKIRHLAPLDGCACGFEELSLRRTKSAVISESAHFVSLGEITIIWSKSWENLFYVYVNNKGADQPAHPRSSDQPAHPRSLISTFVVRV